MESPEFVALRADPRYSDINVNGKSVEKHYKKIKAQTIVDLGWSSPETMNLSGKEGDLTDVQKNIKIILMEEEEEAAAKKLKEETKEKLDKNVADVLENDRANKARKRRFFDLNGDIVNSKGQLKIKKEESPCDGENADDVTTSSSRQPSRWVDI